MKLRIICLLATVGMFPRPCEAETQPKRKTETAVIDLITQELVRTNVRDAVNAEWLTVLSGRTIGVRVSPVDSAMRKHVPATQGKYGLIVTSVIKDSPAAKAGIKLHDLILSVNGKFLADGKQLKSAVQANKKAAVLSILRSGKLKKIDVRLTAPATVRADTVIRWVTATHAFYQSKYVIGVHTNAADATLIKQLVLPPSTGRVITAVDSKSPAAIAGLQPHDLILRVGATYLRTSAGLGKELDKEKGKPVTIEFLRAGRKQTCAVTPKKRATVSVTYGAFDDLYFRNRILASQDWRKNSRSQPSANLQSQINKLSTQMANVQKALEALRKSVETSNNRKK